MRANQSFVDHASEVLFSAASALFLGELSGKNKAFNR